MRYFCGIAVAPVAETCALADYGGRACADETPTRGHKHRNVPDFVRLNVEIPVMLLRDIRHTQLRHYFVAWVDLLSLSGGYPPT
jgi:hypothetical protein